MDEKTAALVGLSSALARGSRGEWREQMTRAMALATPVEIEETLLQSYLFVGYPTALQALTLWRDLAGEVASKENQADLANWMRRGEKVCATVYGGQYDRLRENIERIHPDLARWMLTEGYGKVLGRPGLDLRTRELCIIALLAAQDAPKQLYSHLRGALNAGATAAEVDEVIGSVVRLLTTDRAQHTRQLWAEVRARKLAEKDST